MPIEFEHEVGVPLIATDQAIAAFEYQQALFDASVATCHTVARFTSQGRDAPHEGAANAKNMNVHGAHCRQVPGLARAPE